MLVIIPKTLKTIIGIFHNERCIFKDTLPHEGLVEPIQAELITRQQAVLEKLNEAGINLSKLDAVSSNGGLLRPVEGGTYQVNELMQVDLNNNYNGKHVSNLGGLLAVNIADGLNIPAYIVDPPVVDELSTVARYSGLPSINRKSIFHALNQKAAARQTANALFSNYEDVNLIVAHIGNGITIGAHEKGRVTDVNNGLHGDGPFSLERTGTIPLQALIDLCYSGKYQKDDIIHEVTFNGGLKAYLPVESFIEVEEKIRQNDRKAKTVLEAMGYQVAKEIGAMAAVLKGNVDGIALTGDFANSRLLTDYITEQINWIADIFIYPGESDLQDLNAGTLRVLRKEENSKTYTGNGFAKGEEIYDERI